jgi:hypothetical protein
MKIYINTIPQEEVINSLEAADKAIADVKVGEPSKELLDAKAIADAAACPVIADRAFPIGEWIHLDENDIDAVEMAKYPHIREAHVVLEEKMKQAIEEKGLGSFAEGIKQAADTYKQELPTIADTVLKIAPMKVIE